MADKTIFIREKLANFNKFLGEMFKEYPEADHVKRIYEQLAVVAPEVFIAAIRENLVKYEGRVHLYVEQVAVEHKLDLAKFKRDHVEKFERYIEMFIDVAK